MIIIKDTYLEQILNKLIEYNSQPILVGGCIRDHFLDIEIKDYDIEVYGLNYIEGLEEILQEFGEVNLVGKCFGIVKLSTPTMEYDFSFPRLENKIADGHTGFEVIVNGQLDFKEASKRRDFTINAIGYDYKNKIFLDPFNGVKDIQQKLLKHINDDTFCEDPLRVYRAVQFSARFKFSVDEKTFELCQKIVQTKEFFDISKERIYEEYKKLFLKSSKPSIGLYLINRLKIENIPVNKIEYLDEIALKNMDKKDKLVAIFTIIDDIFSKISNDKKLLKKIICLQKFEVPRIFINKLDPNDTFIERLLVKQEMLKSMPKPLYMGKDLVKMGYKPSEKFKTILDTLYKMQLNGDICSK